MSECTVCMCVHSCVCVCVCVCVGVGVGVGVCMCLHRCACVCPLGRRMDRKCVHASGSRGSCIPEWLHV